MHVPNATAELIYSLKQKLLQQQSNKKTSKDQMAASESVLDTFRMSNFRLEAKLLKVKLLRIQKNLQ